MGMGAQNRGATGVPAPTQMAMQGAAAPQGLMALMQQRGKGAGMPGGMPPGMSAPGTNQPDPQLLAAMQAFQNQTQPAQMIPSGVPMPKMPGMIDSGGMPDRIQFMDNLQSPTMPGAPGKGAGLPPPRTQEEMQRAMDKMVGASMGPPPGVLVSQPAPGKGGGMPPRPGVPSTMVNPARPRRNDSGPSQAERTRMMAQRTGPGGR
jgi:hypothetical protein